VVVMGNKNRRVRNRDLSTTTIKIGIEVYITKALREINGDDWYLKKLVEKIESQLIAEKDHNKWMNPDLQPYSYNLSYGYNSSQPTIIRDE